MQDAKTDCAWLLSVIYLLLFSLFLQHYFNITIFRKDYSGQLSAVNSRVGIWRYAKLETTGNPKAKNFQQLWHRFNIYSTRSYIRQLKKVSLDTKFGDFIIHVHWSIAALKFKSSLQFVHNLCIFFVEIPIYLEIPPADYCETSYDRTHVPKVRIALSISKENQDKSCNSIKRFKDGRCTYKNTGSSHLKGSNLKFYDCLFIKCLKEHDTIWICMYCELFF